jgi:curli biogenesis system outer membrane secretion channel CsgG
MTRGFVFKSWLFCTAALVLVVLAGCGPTMTGAVKEDVTLTEETASLEEAGREYRGPEYNIAIMTFNNKTPTKVLGIGEVATEILRTIVKKAGLEPVLMSESEMRDQERLIALQQTGAVKTGRKSADEGFVSVDYRISGAITSYSELEESTDILIAKTKTRIARVQVDYALVDVASGKSLLVESGTGEYRKKTGGILGFGSKSTADPGLRDGALRDALTKAMNMMITKLNAEPFRSTILAVEGDTVYIRAGTRSRFDPGTVFTVYRTGAEFVDPETGRVVGRRQKLIGEIVITGHQSDRISKASVESGVGLKAGDIVRSAK